MEATNEEVSVKRRQVKITFEGLNATVKVNGSDNVMTFDIDGLDDNIKHELLQYGWKQKVSDFRASDKLVEDEKVEAIAECHTMLESGEFRQKGAVREKVSIEDQLAAWSEMSDTEKANVNLISPNLFKKLEKASQ